MMFIRLVYDVSYGGRWFILNNNLSYIDSIDAQNLNIDHFKQVDSNYYFKEKMTKEDKFINIPVGSPEKMWKEFLEITTLMEII